jgi:hypothetical protein
MDRGHVAAAGSSPHLRETLDRAGKRRLCVRFIPASAGNTLQPSPVRPEIRFIPASAETRRVNIFSHPPTRFIPASAGNTSDRPGACTSRAVHSRVRGKHNGPVVGGIVGLGSSPRPGETPSPTPRKPQEARFIPASAGNTWAARLPRFRAAVHSRVRGKHPARVFVTVSPTGSSPRPRETLVLALLSDDQLRFIPASAGNTKTRLSGVHRHTVHPRVRGKHRGLDRGQTRVVGSSPRPRETHPKRGLQAERKRFIPASAGNTSPTCSPAPAPPVHPRVRGKHAAQDVIRRGKRTPIEG